MFTSLVFRLILKYTTQTAESCAVLTRRPLAVKGRGGPQRHVMQGDAGEGCVLWESSCDTGRGPGQGCGLGQVMEVFRAVHTLCVLSGHVPLPVSEPVHTGMQHQTPSRELCAQCGSQRWHMHHLVGTSRVGSVCRGCRCMGALQLPVDFIGNLKIL